MILTELIMYLSYMEIPIICRLISTQFTNDNRSDQ
jgi:hypothetical protein